MSFQRPATHVIPTARHTCHSNGPPHMSFQRPASHVIPSPARNPECRANRTARPTAPRFLPIGRNDRQSGPTTPHVSYRTECYMCHTERSVTRVIPNGVLHVSYRTERHTCHTERSVTRVIPYGAPSVSYRTPLPLSFQRPATPVIPTARHTCHSEPATHVIPTARHTCHSNGPPHMSFRARRGIQSAEPTGQPAARPLDSSLSVGMTDSQAQRRHMCHTEPATHVIPSPARNPECRANRTARPTAPRFLAAARNDRQTAPGNQNQHRSE